MHKRLRVLSFVFALLIMFNLVLSSVQYSYASEVNEVNYLELEESISPTEPKISFGPYRTSGNEYKKRAYEPFKEDSIESGDVDLNQNTSYRKDRINIKIKENPYMLRSSVNDILSYGIKELNEIEMGISLSGALKFNVNSLESSEKWYSATLRPGYEVEEVIASLQNEPTVVVAEPEFYRKVRGQAVPVSETDPGISQQWYLEKSGITEAWNYLAGNEKSPGGNKDVIVAVIDTGVDYTHPDLQGNMWINTGEIPNNGIDDDGNGYIDDVHGANVTVDYYWDNNKGNPQDDHGHGTHVAGIIGAMGNNNEGGAGVAYNVQIMAIKAAQSSGILTPSDIAEAINYAVNMGADVINMSFGGYGRSTLEEDALQRAFGTSVLVAAAGNDGINNEPAALGRPMYPAAYNWVLGVMAQREYPDGRGDNIAGFSNWDIIPQDSFEYEIMAPGVEIFSTLPNGKYAKWSGTSMAAPMVSGVAALLRSQYTDKEEYSSRFIMGQIASTGALKQGKTYSMSAPPTKYRELDAYQALTNTPKPELSFLEYYLFDTKDIDSINNEDGVADSGETIDLGLVLRNHWGKADNVQVTIDTLSPGGVSDPFVEIVQGNVNYGAIGSFNIDDNGLLKDEFGAVIGVNSPFKIKIATDTPNDHLIKFNVRMTSSNGFDSSDTQEYLFDGGFTISVKRGRELPRIISTDMVLTNEDFWIVPDKTLIENGVTVTVEKGTQIQFWSADPKDPYSQDQIPYLQVEGEFITKGTEDEPVEIFNSGLYPGMEVNMRGNIYLNYSKVMNPVIEGKEFDHCYFT